MKKGFTLIELLAVIIILAVITLITTPIVLDVVESAKKSAFESSAYGVIDAVKLKSMENRLNGETLVGEYEFPNVEIEVQGQQPSGGKIVVDSQGRIAVAVYDGKWCATKSYLEGTVTVKEYIEGECELPFVLLGDINGDGKINNKDITCIKKILTGSLLYNLSTADMNQDGKINSEDVEIVKTYTNSEIKIMVPINPNIKVEYASVLVGDLNEDNSITSADVDVITNILNKITAADPELLTLSDINKDLVVNEIDVEILNNYINNVEDSRTQYINTEVQINPNIKLGD